MFRSLYHFKKTHPTSIGFEENENFIELPGATGDKNWYYVVNSNGQAGYIPKNYVEKNTKLNADEFKTVAEGIKERVKVISTLGNREKGELLAKIDRARINHEKTLVQPSSFLVDVNTLKPQTSTASESSSRSSTPPKNMAANKKRAAPKPPALNSVKSSSSSREPSPGSSGKGSMIPDDVDAIQTVAEHNQK